MRHIRFRSFAAAFAAVLLVGSLATPLAAQQKSRAQMVSAIDSVVASYLKGGKAAGMSIAVIKGRDTLALKGYGSADLELNTPTPARAVYEIGSVTKQFTAAAILQLRDAGKLSLTDNILKYLPNYPTQGHTITVGQLLDHTSGMKDYTSLPKFGTIASRNLPRDTLIAMFQAEPFDFNPGELQLYTNSAYFLAGLIIEKTSGETYADYIKKHLFEKAGMPDSRYCSESAIIPRKAHGYDMGAKGLENKSPLAHVYPFSAGSICSTAGDLAAWNRALHGGKVLSAAAYHDITTPSKLNDGTTIRYAKGLAIHKFDGRRVIEHGGGINGFLSQSTYYPDDDAIIVVLINSGGPVAPAAVAKSLANVVLAPVKAVSATYTGDLAAFAGEYNGPGRGRPSKRTITVVSGKLQLAAEGLPKPLELSYRTGDLWEHDDQLVTFVRDGGKVTKMKIDQAYGYSVLTKK